jgi:ribonuclease R
VTELPRDYFHFDAVRHALIGERSGRTYQLAGRVRVKVARVDLERAKIDFTLDETAQPADAASLERARPLSFQAAPASSPRPSVREALARGARPRARKGRRPA